MGNPHMVRYKGSVPFAGVLAGLLLVFAAVMPAAAASSSASGNGLRISPVSNDLTINPGQTQTVTVYVQDVTSAPVTLQALINDFTASGDESGAPALLLNPNQYAPSHSLKRYVAPIGNITLQPGEQKGVSVAVTIPKDVPGGGYYGAVRFVPVASNGGSSNVTLSASVASLILVRVPGPVKENMQLLSLDARSGVNAGASVVFTSGKGLVAAARFQNTGDVQEQPFGKLLLKQGSKVLATYEINNVTPRGNVLPGSIRKFTVGLTKVGFFGKYTLVGNFGYGTSGQLLSGQTTFYVVPVTAIAGVVILALLIIFFIFVFPKMLRRYNQRVIRKATRR